uniref:Uncharacterized protein n=1 Tax=Solanum tuberosum TaxID=4113 RepID=M1DAR7_SOLTU
MQKKIIEASRNGLYGRNFQPIQGGHSYFEGRGGLDTPYGHLHTLGEVPLPKVPKMPSVVPPTIIPKVVVDVNVEDEVDRLDEELAEKIDEESL